MIASLVRKARRFLDDPVLRRWTIGALLGRYRRPQPFVAHRPPYLQNLAALSAGAMVPNAAFKPSPDQAVTAPLTLALPGATITLSPDDIGSLYRQHFSDTETLLAVHRFAWLPLQATTVSPGWVNALWREWIAGFGVPDDSWAWHPYTAAERAINILDYAARVGLPGSADESVAVLGRHASAIADRLEYFGDHDTGNHLSNNGRGLYRIGLALGIEPVAETGLSILLNEAERIFRPSGVLREGSSHYHMLLTRNYADAWLAAHLGVRPEAPVLRRIVERAIAVSDKMILPAGMPLIGDISPDCPPAFLDGLRPGGDKRRGWCGLLTAQARAALEELDSHMLGGIAADGWVRYAAGSWTMLAYIAPDGWVPMPGHGHQDMGSFEAHWESIPLVIDPGRGEYGEAPEAVSFTFAAAHNGLTIDDQEPYPPNKPYYDAKFRALVCGEPPRIAYGANGPRIVHTGFSRFQSIGSVERAFSFHGSALTITDWIDGTGSHIVRRRLHIPWPTRMENGHALIDTSSGIFRVSADGIVRCKPSKRWTAYGVSETSWVIEIETSLRLPAQLELSIQKVSN